MPTKADIYNAVKNTVNTDLDTLTNNIKTYSSRGFHDAEFLSNIDIMSVTGLTVGITYYFKLNIDGTGIVEYNFIFANGIPASVTTRNTWAFLINDLVNLLNPLNAEIKIIDDKLRFFSKTEGITSTIVISDGTSGTNLFDPSPILTNFTGYGTDTIGSADNISEYWNEEVSKAIANGVDDPIFEVYSGFYTSVVDPTVDNDGVDSAGLGRSFDVFDFWGNTNTKLAWICLDNTTHAANWQSLTSGSTDKKVSIDTLASADYIGAASTDGVLRSLSPITYTDGGNFITIGISQSGVAADGYLSLTDWGTFNNKESVLTFSTGLTRTVNTITTNDSQINHNNLSNTHNLTTNIDHNSITNTHQGVDTGDTPSFTGLTSTSIVNIDDGVGDSPLLYLIDADNKFLSLQKMDAGEANIINDEGQINIKPSGDVDDYLVISTATNVVQIGVDDDLDLLQLTTNLVTCLGDLQILSNITLIESLQNGTFDSGDNWTLFKASIGGGQLTFTHSFPEWYATATQAVGVMSNVMGDSYYRFTYDVISAGGYTLKITAGFPASDVALSVEVGLNKRTFFKSAAVPTNFVLNSSSTGGTRIIDNLRLELITSSPLFEIENSGSYPFSIQALGDSTTEFNSERDYIFKMDSEERLRIPHSLSYGKGGAVLTIDSINGSRSYPGFTIINTTNAVTNMSHSATPLLFKQYYYDAVTPAAVSSGSIEVSLEGNWTSTASTQDASMIFHTALNGSLEERLRLTSAGGTRITSHLYFYGEYDCGTITGNALTINWNDGNCQKVIMQTDGNATLTFSNGANATYIFRIIHDDVERTLTFPSSYHVGETGVSAKVYTLAAGVTFITMFTIYCDGTNYYVTETAFHTYQDDTTELPDLLMLGGM